MAQQITNREQPTLCDTAGTRLLDDATRDALADALAASEPQACCARTRWRCDCGDEGADDEC